MIKRTAEFLGNALGSAVGSAIGSAASARRNNNTTINTTVINNYSAPSAQQLQPVRPIQNHQEEQIPDNLELKCPNCMGERDIDEANMVLVCPYCDSRQVIPANHISAYRRLKGLNGSPDQINWQPVNNQPNQRVQPIYSVPQNTNSTNVQNQKKRTWLWVLGWIFIFPVPLTILLLRNRTLPNAARYGIIAVVWVFYGIFAFASNSDSSNNTAKSNNEIAVSAYYSEFKGEDYKDVEKRLKSAGFTNIELNPMEDLLTGWVSEENTVEKVSINGVTNFNKNDKFPADADIVITYHSFEIEDSTNETDSKTYESTIEHAS